MTQDANIVTIKPVDLKVDPHTQRKFDQNHAKKIAKNFDPSLVGLLEVSQRPGGYYVIDGQHRRAAAIMAGHGDKPLVCHVIAGLTEQDEAHRFVGINATVKKPTAADLFRLRVKAGEPVASDISRILIEFQLSVSMASNDGTVSAVTAIELVYNGWGTPMNGKPNPDLLRTTIGALHQTWGRKRDAYDSMMLKAMGSLLGTFAGQVDIVRLTQKLAKAGSPGQMIGRARSLSDAMGISRPLATRRVMVDTYNSGLRSNRLELP